MLDEEKIDEYKTLISKRKISIISLIIPVYNESENIEPLYNELIEVLNTTKKKFEIIFVDDGSTDDSKFKIFQICKKNPQVKLVELRSNFGQSTAISVGFANANGQVAITMDADLQNDPHDIPKMLEMIEDGYDVVSGWRKDRKDPIGKRLPSKISNWLARKLTGVMIHDNGCTLKAFHRDAYYNLVLYGENHRYISALIASEGYKIGEIVVNHRSRKHGTSKYGSGRMIRGFLDLVNLAFLTKYMVKPFQFYGKIGAAFIGSGVVIALYKILQLVMFGQPLDVGPLLLFSVLLFLSGIQFVLFGFFAEMQTKIFTSKNIHSNKVKEIHNFSND